MVMEAAKVEEQLASTKVCWIGSQKRVQKKTPNQASKQVNCRIDEEVGEEVI